MNSLRITFVIRGVYTHPAGGPKIIFEYARRLAKLGHTITICFWNDLRAGRIGTIRLPVGIKRIVEELRVEANPRWFDVGKEVKKLCVFDINDNSIPDSDWVIATAVTTADSVARLSRRKGKKAYLIQDYETFAAAENVVRDSFRLGMLNIVVSSWLKDIVEAVSDTDCLLLPNPIDTSVFYPDTEIKREKNRVALLYHKAEYKGWQYAWDALRQSHETIPDLTISMFGVFAKPAHMPHWVSYTRNASETQLRKIYSQAAVFVCASVEEGFGLTCLEAMGCGCALVATSFRGANEYAINEVNSLLSPVKDSSAMAANITRVLTNTHLREFLASEGIRAASLRSWESAVDLLEGALKG